MDALTGKEKAVLFGITDSDFFAESGVLTDPVYVWSVVSPYTETPSMGGIVASLVKKGLVKSSNIPGDANVIRLTAKGVETLRSLSSLFSANYASYEVKE